MIRDWGGRRAALFDAEEEMRRNQDLLEGERDPLLETIALGLRHRDQLGETGDFLRSDRAPERAARQRGNDLPGAGSGVAAVQVSAGVDLFETLRGRSGDLIMRPGDFQITDEERGAGLTRESADIGRSSAA